MVTFLLVLCAAAISLGWFLSSHVQLWTYLACFYGLNLVLFNALCPAVDGLVCVPERIIIEFFMKMEDDLLQIFVRLWNFLNNRYSVICYNTGSTIVLLTNDIARFSKRHTYTHHTHICIEMLLIWTGYFGHRGSHTHTHATFMLLGPFWPVMGQNTSTLAVFIHVCRMEWLKP